MIRLFYNLCLKLNKIKKLLIFLMRICYNFEIYMILTLFLNSRTYQLLKKNKSWKFRNYIK